MMKYLILFITVVLIFVSKPWNFSFGYDEDLLTELENISFLDTIESFGNYLLPAGAVIQNLHSEYAETITLDKTIEKFLKDWNIAGASFALMKDGKLLFSKGYGYADKESEIPVDVNHTFRVASISKLITAVAIMKLYDDGKLDLNDKVFGKNGILNDDIYLKYKDKKVEQITVDHLLRHQGGFSKRTGDPMFNSLSIAYKMKVTPPAQLSDIIEYTLTQPLRYRPGTVNSYSNVGYGILSKIIEKLSGEEYETYVRNNVLLPAGCFDMYLGKSLYEDKQLNEVKYYSAPWEGKIRSYDGSNQLVPIVYGGNNIECLEGAGGWVASPTELLRLLSVIDGDPTIPDILKPETVELMTTPKGAFPIGWMYAHSNGEWTRTGTFSGTTAIMRKQADGYSWAFITNTTGAKGPKFHPYVANMVNLAMNKVEEWPTNDLFELQNFSYNEYLVSND